jgi:hypothetical protein
MFNECADCAALFPSRSVLEGKELKVFPYFEQDLCCEEMFNCIAVE